MKQKLSAPFRHLFYLNERCSSGNYCWYRLKLLLIHVIVLFPGARHILHILIPPKDMKIFQFVSKFSIFVIAGRFMINPNTFRWSRDILPEVSCRAYIPSYLAISWQLHLWDQPPDDRISLPITEGLIAEVQSDLELYLKMMFKKSNSSYHVSKWKSLL